MRDQNLNGGQKKVMFSDPDFPFLCACDFVFIIHLNHILYCKFNYI